MIGWQLLHPKLPSCVRRQGGLEAVVTMQTEKKYPARRGRQESSRRRLDHARSPCFLHAETMLLEDGPVHLIADGDNQILFDFDTALISKARPGHVWHSAV